MLEITLKQVFDLSGVYDDDSDLVKDMKLRAWLGNRTSRAVDQSGDLEEAREQAINDAVEVLIIKEK